MSQSNSPNVLLILTDQHRGSALDCADNEPVKAPNMGRIARNGTCFTHAYANTPVCAPSRASLLTGQYPEETGVLNNGEQISSEATTLGESFAAAGYHTAYIGKWHLSGAEENYVSAGAEAAEHVRSHGFDRAIIPDAAHSYFDVDHHICDDNGVETIETEGYAPTVQTDYALNFLREGDDPWCLIVSYGPPHNPYEQVPEEYREMYNPEKIPLQPNVEPILPLASAHPEPGAMWAPPSSVGSVDLEVSGYTSKHTYVDPREGLADYYAQISAVDRQVGRLLDGLDSLNLTEDTLVIYTSDHGDQLWSQGHAQKSVPYEESIHIPLLIRWPGEVPAGRKTDAMISLVDLVPTLYELAGINSPPETTGKDLSTLVSGGTQEGREVVPLLHHAAEWYGIRTPRYTYAQTVSEELPHLPNNGWLLFDNESDPYQLENLLYDPAHHDVRKECEQLITDFFGVIN